MALAPAGCWAPVCDPWLPACMCRAAMAPTAAHAKGWSSASTCGTTASTSSPSRPSTSWWDAGWCELSGGMPSTADPPPIHYCCAGVRVQLPQPGQRAHHFGAHGHRAADCEHAAAACMRRLCQQLTPPTPLLLLQVQSPHFFGDVQCIDYRCAAAGLDGARPVTGCRLANTRSHMRCCHIALLRLQPHHLHVRRGALLVTGGQAGAETILACGAYLPSGRLPRYARVSARSRAIGLLP